MPGTDRQEPGARGSQGTGGAPGTGNSRIIPIVEGAHGRLGHLTTAARSRGQPRIRLLMEANSAVELAIANRFVPGQNEFVKIVLRLVPCRNHSWPVIYFVSCNPSWPRA